MKQWLRKKLPVMAATVSILGSGLTAYGAEPISVQIDGAEYNLTVPPVVQQNTMLVGMREVFELLGANLQWEPEAQQIVVFKDQMILELKVGSDTAYKNGQSLQLSVAPQIVGENTMVPLRFVSEALGSDVKWNEKNRMVSIVTEEGKQLPKEETAYFVMEEADEETRTLTLDEAVDQAIAKNTSLIKLIENMKITEDQRKAVAQDVVTQRSADLGQPFVTDAATYSGLINLTKMDLGLESGKIQLEMQKEIIALQLQNTFSTILNAEKDLAMAKLSLENEKRQLEITDKRYELGLESEINQIKAHQSYEQKLHTLANQKKALENEYIKLNGVLGFKESERYQLAMEYEYTPIEEINLDAFIARQASSAPTIKLKEQDVRQQQYNLNMYSYTGTGDSYAAREASLDQAKRDVSDAKKDLEQKIRTTYNQIKQIEVQYQSDLIDLQKARDQLKTAKVQLEAGMITENEIKSLELAVASAELKVQKTALQHHNLVTTFAKPYLL